MTKIVISSGTIRKHLLIIESMIKIQISLLVVLILVMVRIQMLHHRQIAAVLVHHQVVVAGSFDGKN